ncbi:hypothetical protein BTVI_85789 [Pitangus sulphuratus]|nr:hypothetical protein BTVI_85789 [Pitangus sulphuratus]
MGCIQRCQVLADAIARPPWKDDGSQGRQKKANITAILMKGKEEHPGNNWPISLTSVSRKIIELVFLEAMSKNMMDGKVTENSQHGEVDLQCCVQFCASLYRKDMDILEASAVESNQDGQRLKQVMYMERLQEQGVFSLRNRRFSGDLTVVFGHLVERYKEERARLFSEACTKEQSTTTMSCNKGNFFHHEGGKALELVALGGCEIFYLGNIHSKLDWT